MIKEQLNSCSFSYALKIIRIKNSIVTITGEEKFK